MATPVPLSDFQCVQLWWDVNDLQILSLLAQSLVKGWRGELVVLHWTPTNIWASFNCSWFSSPKGPGLFPLPFHEETWSVVSEVGIISSHAGKQAGAGTGPSKVHRGAYEEARRIKSACAMQMCIVVPFKAFVLRWKGDVFMLLSIRLRINTF